MLSKVLGEGKKLITRFSNILITINCNNSINPTKFTNYCNGNFLDSYGNWYKFPASIHKILAHGANIILNSPLPFVVLGEEASECRNKFYPRDRENHVRKNSRESNSFDVFRRAMNTSDLIISSLSLAKRTKYKPKTTRSCEKYVYLSKN